jgi:hypothetical protein
MTQEPRKATDILLELESKIEVLLNTVRSQDLNIKVISNKLNKVMEGLEKQQAAPPRITVEAVQHPSVPNQVAQLFGQVPNNPDPERNVLVTAESKLPVEEGPKGFRRTSRPESYSDEKVFRSREVIPLPPPPVAPPLEASKANRPPPGRSVGEVVTAQIPAPKNKAAPAPNAPKVATEAETHGIVPVEQRVVDRNGKSVFLADVEIIDLTTGEQVSKSRTTATGKWMAALPLGNYKVIIRKLESITRDKIESVQTIKVDGSEAPLRLQMIIIK